MPVDISWKRDNIASIVYCSWRLFHRRSLKWIAFFFFLTVNLCARNFIHCSGYFYLFSFLFMCKWFAFATKCQKNKQLNWSGNQWLLHDTLSLLYGYMLRSKQWQKVSITFNILKISAIWSGELAKQNELAKWGGGEDGEPASVRFQQFFRFNRYQMNNKNFSRRCFFSFLCVYSIFIVFVAESKFLGRKFIGWKSVSRSFCRQWWSIHEYYVR